MRLFGRKSRSFTLRPEPVGRGPELGTVPEIRVEAPPADDEDEQQQQQRRRHLQPSLESQQRAACHSNGDHHHQRVAAVNDKRSTQCDDDEEDEDEEPPGRFSRRKSVFAEHYDPAEDEDDESAKVVYPKSDEQRERLGEAVKNILLFKSLDQNQMQEVIDAMFERKVKPGEVVIKQGDDGDNFYVIHSGIYHIFVTTDKEKDKLVGKYDGTGSFGELALMYNMPRAATITAVTEGSLWAMNRQTFRRIVLKSAFKKRKEYENLLEKVPMLKSLNHYERMNLCDALMPRAYKDGDLIIMQGDAADGMYFIEDGTVRICVKKDGGNETEVSRISKGGYFGELALLTKKPRAATVYAVGPVKLAFLDVSAFERLLGPCKEIMMRNIDQYEEQMVQAFGTKVNVADLR
ncbi:cAMP-dependent protein kinase type II regulatory subunit isoform X1 [Rhipicephalus sanguineus]|uniref:cAMP-dependent protein kinase type II regulatory subunit isoform X1 n=1 Tax=Rhipicephalus sanguineus TaxID=34632 RepID=UPI001894FD91|nr:cAMP-dependent protein kinase type II regulatory subunit isoform X1 [Rhipicephalus sanguineus]